VNTGIAYLCIIGPVLRFAHLYSLLTGEEFILILNSEFLLHKIADIQRIRKRL
jgi:hypothetical protein